MMAYITAESATPENSHRFFVELASDELELDAWGIEVPKDFKVIDLVVSEPTKQAIIEALLGVEELKGYTIVDYFRPLDECPF
jgi:hypothetical protein